MRIPLYQVDAFTNQPFAGNPAAVCPLDCWLDDDLLGKVAAENNLSETSFFVPRPGIESGSRSESYDLRWFTPRSEVKLCGHATLASAHVLLKLLRPELDKVRFQTRSSGTLTVAKNDNFLAMDFPAIPTHSCARPPEELIRGLGSRPAQILEGDEIFLAVYDNEAAVRAIRPEFQSLERLHPFCASVTAPGEQFDFVSRYFAPSFGVPEDPVTGSAHCALTPYWATRLGKTSLHAGQISQRGGELWCEAADRRVILKGQAVLTVEGFLLI